MTNGSAQFIDRRQHAHRPNDMWPVVVVAAADLAAAVARVEEAAAGPDGRREVQIAHPRAQAPGLGLSPGIDVVFGSLLPGEVTRRRRHNASEVAMVLAGDGTTTIGSTTFDLGARDVYVTPAMHPHTLGNSGGEPLRYVAYTNRPMLQKLEVFYEELDPPTPADEHHRLAQAAERSGAAHRAKELAPGFQIGDDGSWLLPYEHLIDPDPVESPPLLWRWADVAPHLGLVRDLPRGYNGRPLYCLYNPATGSRNGTTSCFFATIASAPPDGVGPVHRHASAAINLILDGGGWSIVGGDRVEWQAGDIMLSAPGWAPHRHATGPEGAVILTIQDHPLHIATESLIWQEDLKAGPILSLGTQAGFQTNLAELLNRGAS